VPILVWRTLFIAYLAAVAFHIGWVVLHEPFYFDAWNVALTSGAKPITVDRFFDFWWFEYTHSNPRLGQALTYLSYKLEYFAPVAMSLAFLAIGAAVTTLGTGRLPSMRRGRDLALWTFATGALWFALPQLGKTMFCRAYGANYVYTAAIQLWFLVPLRLRAGSGTLGSRAASPVALVAYALFGIVAGLCNEHTGPTLCLFLVLYAWTQRDRLATAGAVGAIAGFAALFFAPGQGERYEGLAQKAGMWGRVMQRGIDGNFEILRDIVVYAAPTLLLIALVMIAIIVRAGVENLRELLRPRLRLLGLALGASLLIALTIFVSPKLGPRFYYVSMALVLAGFVGIADALLSPRQLALLAAVAILASGYAAYRTVPLYQKLAVQGEARIAALEASPRGKVFIADAFSQIDENWWSLGDDFRDAKKRELVAKYFDLQGVVFRAYNPNVPLGVMSARLVPRYDVTPAGCLDEHGGFALGSFKGFDLAGLQREMKISIALLRERLGSAAQLRKLELEVQLDDPGAKLPRPRILVGRWLPDRFEGPIGRITRKTRGRTRDIELPKELARKDVEVFVYNVGGEARRIGTGGGEPLQYVPWTSGVYWMLACPADECWVIAATRQGG
jgi:hypothetical protein